MFAYAAAGNVMTVRPRPLTTFESSLRQPLAMESARADAATTRCICLRTGLVSIVVALGVVVVALVLLRLVLRFVARFHHAVVVTFGTRDHSTVLVDAARIVDDATVRIDATRVVYDGSARIGPPRVVHDGAAWIYPSRIIYASALVVHVPARIARVRRGLVAVDDAGIGRNARGSRRAVGRGGLMPRRNAVDPNPAHSGRRTLARRHTPIAAATTLRHRRRRDRERGYHCSKLDFSHRFLRRTCSDWSLSWQVQCRSAPSWLGLSRLLRQCLLGAAKT